MTALPSGHAATDGFLRGTCAAYYIERAASGVGVLVTEPLYALPPQRRPVAHLGLYDDAFIPDLQACMAAVRQHGTVMLAMIDQPLHVQDMSSTQLREIADGWITAAGRAQQAGADGVMFSCADDGPFDQLISPLKNRRTDTYGNNSMGRLRLLHDMIERLRQRAGGRLLIGLRLNVEEFSPGGLTLQDARVIAKRLVGAGVDLLEVSAEANGAVPVAQFPGWRVPLAAGIKAVVDVPVMVGGLLADVELADSVIADGSADLVALGETLRAEPRWPRHAQMVLAERISLDPPSPTSLDPSHR